MVAAVALITGGAYDDGASLLSHGVYIGLKQRLTLVGAFIGTIAEVNDTGHGLLSGTVHNKFDAPHDVGAGGAVAAAHFYSNDSSARSNAAAACCNGCRCGAVAYHIPAVSVSLVDLSGRIGGPFSKSQGRGARDGHIP